MPLADLPNVVFDLGGVLLRWDTLGTVDAVFADARTREMAHAAVFEHPDWLELDRGSLSEDEAIQRFATRTGQPRAAMAELMDEVRRCLAPQPAAVDLLIELDEWKVPLYCLSNMHDRNIGFLTGQYGFFERFRDTVFSAEVKLIKPDPAIFKYAESRFGLEAGDCVFVDDAEANVAAARSVGWHALLFTDAAQCRSELESLATTWSG